MRFFFHLKTSWSLRQVSWYTGLPIPPAHGIYLTPRLPAPHGQEGHFSAHSLHCSFKTTVTCGQIEHKHGLIAVSFSYSWYSVSHGLHRFPSSFKLAMQNAKSTRRPANPKSETRIILGEGLDGGPCWLASRVRRTMCCGWTITCEQHTPSNTFWFDKYYASLVLSGHSHQYSLSLAYEYYFLLAQRLIFPCSVSINLRKQNKQCTTRTNRNIEITSKRNRGT